MKYIISIVITIIICSCSDRKNSELLILDNGITLKGIEYDNELIIPNPLSIEFFDNSLYIFQPQGEDAVLIVDINDGRLKGTWGKRGNGPGEFTYPLFWGRNINEKNIYLYDLHHYTLRTYDTTNKDNWVLKEEKKLKQDFAVLRYATVLNNSNIVASCTYNLEYPLLLMNNKLDSITSFGDIPDKDHKSIDLRSYWGHLSSYKNTFVYAMAELGYIACYTLTPTNEIIKQWEHYIEKPIYHGNQLDKTKLLHGFLDVKMTTNYIFCTYSGKKLDKNNLDISPETILVFDHKGKLLKNFHLDRKIGGITISNDEKTIYAVSLEPEVNIIRYKVGKYLHP